MLLSMPFGLPHMPSLGLSLLKAACARRGLPVEVRYGYLPFVEAIGYRLYQRIAQGGLRHLGEWIFRPALWGPPSAADDDAFWDAFAADSTSDLLPGETVADLRRLVGTLQAQATAWIEGCAADTDWTAYRFVGFTSLFQQNLASLALARRIKERAPATTVVFGGSNCEGEMGLALMRAFPFVDYAFSGEADDTFAPFTEAVLAGAEPADAPGIIRRDPATGAPVPPRAWAAPVENLDALPYPDFDDYFAQLPSISHPVRPHVNFETARGCWWGQKNHCRFCGLNGSTLAFRSKSPHRAVAEIAHLASRYGTPHGAVLLRAADQILDMGYFTEVLPHLRAAAGGIPLFFETKSNLTLAQVQALAEARTKMIQPGIESLSTPVLRLMRKGCTMLQNVQILKWCTAVGVVPIWNLLYGFPGEEPEHYAATADIIPLLVHLQPPKNAGRIRLDRFSPYFMDPRGHGLTNLRPPPAFAHLYPVAEEDRAGLCYRFDFDYADGRDLSYAGPALEAARRWMEAPHRGPLVGFDDGERLVVWDARREPARWTAFDGALRDAFLFADAIRPEAEVARRLAAILGPEAGAVVHRQFLDEGSRRGLLLREDGKLLGLIVLKPGATAPALPPGMIEIVTPKAACRTTAPDSAPHPTDAVAFEEV
ncbi:RiPP maturation radical SAM C-methyltransferase [Azospirillum sp. TSO22-1]|uniref:RiPP maturation radical SAM C-methyltransferase n=1 Tax=Azospirillum sp. TSO22-1 TaxID=716789 RepID=UPI000D64E628|nr:RiPP maturation radical SAM C-methyltransferase [Azospirillum sp. TSO22-1]